MSAKGHQPSFYLETPGRLDPANSGHQRMLRLDKDLENLVPVFVEAPCRTPSQVPIKTVRSARRVRRTPEEQPGVTKFRQFPNSPIQQFSTNTKILKIRKHCEDLYLSGFAHAEAEANYFSIDKTNVTWKRARTNVFSPRFRCDADRT